MEWSTSCIVLITLNYIRFNFNNQVYYSERDTIEKIVNDNENNDN